MPVFELHLAISPAFHRKCSVRIEGDITGQVMFDAPPTGLLPGVALTLPVSREHLEALRCRCADMLDAWDERWSRFGLDGISIYGMFESADAEPRTFSLWSPRKGNLPHEMLAAAFACFPVEDGNVGASELLDIVRSYLDLLPPVTVIGWNPLRLRLAPWVHSKHAAEIKHKLTTLPEDVELMVDASAMERFAGPLARIVPVERLMKRTGVVRWKVHGDCLDELIQAGVEPALIELVAPVSMSRKGEPIVLGGMLVSSPELIATARAGNKFELVRAFRREYALTVEQASKAAMELMEIVAATNSE